MMEFIPALWDEAPNKREETIVKSHVLLKLILCLLFWIPGDKPINKHTSDKQNGKKQSVTGTSASCL